MQHGCTLTLYTGSNCVTLAKPLKLDYNKLLVEIIDKNDCVDTYMLQLCACLA